MLHVVYIKNRRSDSALGCSPFEKLTGKKPMLNHVRVFGCTAFMYDHKLRSKVHARALPAIYLGSDDNGVYTVELLASRKIVNSVHVTFDETAFPGLEKDRSSSSGEVSSAEGDNDESSYAYFQDSEPFQEESSSSINEEIDKNKY